MAEIKLDEMAQVVAKRAIQKLIDDGVFVGRWIPVSERLPEDSGYYLTTTMFSEVYCDYWTENSFNRSEAIIAWMPLPESYKAESEEV